MNVSMRTRGASDFKLSFAQFSWKQLNVFTLFSELICITLCFALKKFCLRMYATLYIMEWLLQYVPTDVNNFDKSIFIHTHAIRAYIYFYQWEL